jgi:hypothetical protein
MDLHKEGVGGRLRGGFALAACSRDEGFLRLAVP